MLAVRRTFPEMSIRQLAWAVYLGCVFRADGTAYDWRAEEQVHPLHRGLRDHFESRAYRERGKDAAARVRFSLDADGFARKLQAD